MGDNVDAPQAASATNSIGAAHARIAPGYAATDGQARACAHRRRGEWGILSGVAGAPVRLLMVALALAVGACGRRIELGSQIIWEARHETGDLSAWIAAGEGCGMSG